MNTILLQSLGGSNLGCDNSLGIAGSAAKNPKLVLGGRDERWNRVHVRGKHDFRVRMLRRGCVHVGTFAFDDYSLAGIAQPSQLLVEKMPNRAFVPGDRFNVHELARSGEDVHSCSVQRA